MQIAIRNVHKREQAKIRIAVNGEDAVEKAWRMSGERPMSLEKSSLLATPTGLTLREAHKRRMMPRKSRFHAHKALLEKK